MMDWTRRLTLMPRLTALVRADELLEKMDALPRPREYRHWNAQDREMLRTLMEIAHSVRPDLANRQ